MKVCTTKQLAAFYGGSEDSAGLRFIAAGKYFWWLTSPECGSKKLCRLV